MNPLFKFAKLLKPYRKFIAGSILSGIFLTLAHQDSGELFLPMEVSFEAPTCEDVEVPR